MADVYYGNFSVFQSLPDSWAIDQLFPIMPIHRLNERPTRQATLADITCDCDGKIDRFIDLHDVKETLPLHELQDNEDYILGVFLVGAYQETLGDLHNLFGDTNVVSVTVRRRGRNRVRPRDRRRLRGGRAVLRGIRPQGDGRAVPRTGRERGASKRIAPQERREILEAYSAGLRGYTYYEA